MQLKLKLNSPIPRAQGVSNRAVLLALAGRFSDEILSGLPDVLMPTLRAHFRLSYLQISLLGLALNYVAAVVEPITALFIDVWQRRWLLAWGAASIGLAVALMGLAPTFLVLLLAFAVYGLGSGPLAHTADVVLVEAHPEAPGRIFARATAVDTVGALLAPLLVTLTFWLDLSWHWLLAGLGLSGLLYALLLLRTRFPAPAHGHVPTEALWASLRANVRAVLRSRRALLWMAFIFTFDILETPLFFKTVWLNEQVGLSQALVGVYKALEFGASLASLLYLDPWLARTHYKRILKVAGLGLLLLLPLWLLWPGVWARFLLGMPISFLMAVFWPIGRAQLLGSVPGRAGATTAVDSLLMVIPLPLLFGLLAEALTLTRAMLLVTLAALPLLLLLVRRLPGEEAGS